MLDKLTTSLAEYGRRARGLLPKDLFERWFGSRDDPLWLSNTNNVDAYDRVFCARGCSPTIRPSGSP
jgi:hypothetical protein